MKNTLRKFRIWQAALVTVTLASMLCLAAPSASDEATAELERMRDIYRAITSYHTLLQGEGVTKDLVTAALYDVEQYVDLLDNRYATAKLFIEDHRVINDIKEVVAKAHLQASLLHARGVDLESSIEQYEQVVDLLGHDPGDWNVEVARRGKPGLLPGASEAVFQMASPRQAVEDLKSFWASGVVTRFEVREFTPGQREGLRLERVGGGTDAFESAAFGLAAERFVARSSQGLEEFRVVLPPGRYRVVSEGETIPPLEFRLLQGGIPDPIVLNPNTFNFELTTPEGPCVPELTINGMPVRNMTGLSYGTYRVDVPRACERRLPDKIVVEQKSEVTLRTEPEKLDFVKKGQPIFLFITTPPNSTYTLKF
jgi:hypothetical protein